MFNLLLRLTEANIRAQSIETSGTDTGMIAHIFELYLGSAFKFRLALHINR